MKVIYLLLIILSIFYINFTNSQIFNGADTYLDCVVGTSCLELDFDKNTFLSNKNTRTYARYDYSYIKLYLRSNDTGFIGSADLHPRVDEFTTLRVVNTQELIFKDLNESVTPNTGGGIVKKYPGWQVWVEVAANKTIYQYETTETDEPCDGGAIPREQIPECSDPATVTYKKYTTVETNQTVPITLPPKNLIDINTRTMVNYLSIVFQLDNGNIVDALWDGDRLPEVCKSCDSCIDNQCAVNYDDMGCDIDNGCQIKILVAWAGRDRKNSPCQSINKLPSNFQKYSATAIKKIGTGLLSDFFYKINENNNNPNRA